MGAVSAAIVEAASEETVDAISVVIAGLITVAAVVSVAIIALTAASVITVSEVAVALTIGVSTIMALTTGFAVTASVAIMAVVSVTMSLLCRQLTQWVAFTATPIIPYSLATLLRTGSMCRLVATTGSVTKAQAMPYSLLSQRVPSLPLP